MKRSTNIFRAKKAARPGNKRSRRSLYSKSFYLSCCRTVRGRSSKANHEFPQFQGSPSHAQSMGGQSAWVSPVSKLHNLMIKYLIASLAWFAWTSMASAYKSSGLASYYFEPQSTASGERFNPHELTAAHKTLPFGTRVRVTNRHNGKSVVVRINDRGPFVKGRVIDLSRAAARAINMDGVAPVTLATL